MLSSSLFSYFLVRPSAVDDADKKELRYTGAAGLSLSTDFEITDRQQKLVSSSLPFSLYRRERDTRRGQKFLLFFFFRSFSQPKRTDRVVFLMMMKLAAFGFRLYPHSLSTKYYPGRSLSLLSLWETLHKVGSQQRRRSMI